jgi:hypothetical protein
MRIRAGLAFLLAIGIGTELHCHRVWRHEVREWVVPWVEQAPKIDGELNEPFWNAISLRSGPFQRDKKPARPYSEARFASGQDHLYLALYAADQDIRLSGPDADVFRVTFTAGDITTHCDFPATGKVRCTHGGLQNQVEFDANVSASVDYDGTPDHPLDDDEEWVVESAIPLASIGIRADSNRFGVEIQRCDQPHPPSPRLCGTFGIPFGHLVLAKAR